jgi:4a-hydroxytetrahydrobiopterin dehydratase
MEKLSADEVQNHLNSLSEWQLDTQGQITKTVTLDGFAQALLFVNAVGWLAEQMQHHPDILIQWNKVRLTLSTHDAGGLTNKDFALAARIDALGLP